MKGMVTASICGLLLFSIVPAALLKVRGRRFLVFSGAVLGVSLMLMSTSKLAGWEITENLTTSLDGHIYAYKKTGAEFDYRRGEIIAYRWHGGATYPPDTVFIKHIRGVPGDIVHVVGRDVWINGTYVGRAKPYSRAGVPLTPIAGGIIPEGQYFVATASADSLDSRYALSGNVPETAILGRAYEIF